MENRIRKQRGEAGASEVAPSGVGRGVCASLLILIPPAQTKSLRELKVREGNSAQAELWPWKLGW